MSQEKILITGATGFLGRALIHELLEQPSYAKGELEVFTVSRTNLSLPGVNHTPLNLDDVTETKRYLQEIQPSQIYHLSGLSKVSREFSLKDYFASNYLQTKNLIEALESNRHKVKFLLASSVHIYGNQNEIVTEESPVHPQSPYAFSKYLSEECVKAFSRNQNGSKAIVARLSTCFGPGQSSGFVARDFTQKIKEAKLNRLNKITTGPLNSFRQFMDHRDVAHAFRLLMEQEQVTPFEIYNLASPEKKTIHSLLRDLMQLAQIEIEIESQNTGENTFRGLDVPAKKFRTRWPHFSFRPFHETLLEIWEYPD